MCVGVGSGGVITSPVACVDLSSPSVGCWPASSPSVGSWPASSPSLGWWPWSWVVTDWVVQSAVFTCASHKICVRWILYKTQSRTGLRQFTSLSHYKWTSFHLVSSHSGWRDRLITFYLFWKNNDTIICNCPTHTPDITLTEVEIPNYIDIRLQL